MSLPIHKALVWLFVALMADTLPVVSNQLHVPVLSTYRDFPSQVLICLNLNGRFTYLNVLSIKNADDWFDFVRNISSAR